MGTLHCMYYIMCRLGFTTSLIPYSLALQITMLRRVNSLLLQYLRFAHMSFSSSFGAEGISQDTWIQKKLSRRKLYKLPAISYFRIRQLNLHTVIILVSGFLHAWLSNSLLDLPFMLFQHIFKISPCRNQGSRVMHPILLRHVALLNQGFKK